MDIVEQNASVRMVRADLTDIPSYPVPDGYRLHTYSKGNEQDWVAIQKAADRYNKISMELYHNEFGDDTNNLAGRQFFLRDPNGEPIGTSTAWFNKECLSGRSGRIHWIAIVPRCQGLGLSKCLLSRTCSRLSELGYKSACLTTSTARVTAINLYLSFGFFPEIRKEEDRTIWRQMEAYLKFSPWVR